MTKSKSEMLRDFRRRHASDEETVPVLRFTVIPPGQRIPDGREVVPGRHEQDLLGAILNHPERILHTEPGLSSDVIRIWWVHYVPKSQHREVAR
jgi:hypothetical protein